MCIRRAAALCAVLVLASGWRLAAQTPVGMWGTGPGDVWVVSAEAGPIRFDGRQWAKVPLGGETGASLYAVWGSAPGDVFVGGESAGAATVFRWDGGAWVGMRVSSRSPIVALAGRSGTEVYALARSGLPDRPSSVLRWDGRTWTESPLPMPFAVSGLALRGDEVLVAGYVDPMLTPSAGRSPGVLARLRGGQWSLVGRTAQGVTDSAVAAARLSNVLVSGDTVYLVGEREDGKTTVIASWGGAWMGLPSPAVDLQGVNIKLAFLAGDGTLVTLLTGGGGYAYRSAGDWTKIRPVDPYAPPPAMGRDELLRQVMAWDELGDARAAWGPTASDFYVVTGSGRVVRFQGGSAAIVYDVTCADPEVAARSPICRMLRQL